jgi:hypothetical protein
MNRRDVLFVILFIVTVYGIFIYFIIKDSKLCDERVILNDGTMIECRSTSSFNNGMTSLKTCDGERLRIPTRNIKTIKEIKDGK